MNRVRTSAGRQRGGALLELMVGLTIGLMVALAAMVSVAHTRQTSRTLDADVALHQDAATAWRVLGLHLRQAGARRLQEVAGTRDVAFNAGFETTTAKGAAGPIDGNTISITTVSDGDTQTHSANCLGTADPLERIESEFKLADGELRCTSTIKRRSGSSIVGVPPTTGALITGAEDLQLRYVQRIGADLQHLQTPTDWSAVVAVEACLHLASEPNGEIAVPLTDCAGQDVTPADGRLHRVFRRVFQLRNQAR
jgi:type IV pilus assembly protein PilW